MIVANPSINQAAVQASRAAAAQQAHNIQNGIVPIQEAQVGPSVTVFVGNISEKATDTLVRQILMKCGTVNNWKRVQGASGKLQAFGFCEFKEPDSALRALRLLQGYRLGDKELLVNVDCNAQHIIDQWKQRSGIVQDSDGMDVLSQNVKQKDEAVRVELKSLLRDYATDLYVDDGPADREEKTSTPTPAVISAPPTKAKDETKKEEPKTEPGKKKKPEIVNVELTSSVKEKSQSREPSRTSRRDDPPKAREVTSSRRRSRDRERTRDRNERAPSRSNKSEERRRRRSEERRKDEDELLERRRLERKIREKDSAYNERLVGWEARERRRARDWERIESREAEQRRQMAKEARRLRDFLENYDDEKDDRKFYFGSGSAFQRRLQNRDKEKEFDNKDRRKEEEEID